jgi:hypothetical protein
VCHVFPPTITPTPALVQSSNVFIDHRVQAMTGVMVTGLVAFCFIFAVNSSVHSYLIVRWVRYLV